MRILLYIAILAFIVFASNYFYVHLGVYDEDIKNCNAELIYDLDSSLSKKNILYFGESSNFTSSEKDSCKKSISELTGDLDSIYKIGTISKGAIHAATYKALIHRIRGKSSVSVIIVTINLRSFGINWIESDLETNLSRANVLYSNYPPVLKKFLLSFKAYDNIPLFKRKNVIRSHYRNDKFKLKYKSYKTVSDWDAVVFDVGIPNEKGVKDLQQTETACHFIKNYAFILNEKNPRIKDLDDIVNFCEHKNIKLIYNLLPENYEKATRLCGVDLEILMRNNVEFLKERYSKKTTFINNFSLLKDSCFIDKDWPTEHYIYYGRKLISEKINQNLKKNLVE